MELFERMHRDGATEDDLRKLLQDRSEQSLIDPEEKAKDRDLYRYDPPQPERPLPPQAPTWKIGLMVEPIPEVVRDHFALNRGEGVRISEVADGSPAHRLGLQVNDIILSAGDKKIGSIDDLRQAVEQAGREDKPLKLAWIHRGERKDAKLRPEGPPPQADREEGRPGQEGRPAAEGERKRSALVGSMEQLARQMERQQRQIEELRREVEKLKRESRGDE
ncbi:PDZ domain-containing protein [Luteolibacter soli]|uniref:PDZ domain-containing protein n=1 Tax=Luteolibacter soli TaxID=3135280 RepID=A0ABU9AT84_9BACT